MTHLHECELDPKGGGSPGIQQEGWGLNPSAKRIRLNMQKKKYFLE
jgi:hypothetical protein